MAGRARVASGRHLRHPSRKCTCAILQQSKSTSKCFEITDRHLSDIKHSPSHTKNGRAALSSTLFTKAWVDRPDPKATRDKGSYGILQQSKSTTECSEFPDPPAARLRVKLPYRLCTLFPSRSFNSHPSTFNSYHQSALFPHSQQSKSTRKCPEISRRLLNTLTIAHGKLPSLPPLPKRLSRILAKLRT